MPHVRSKITGLTWEVSAGHWALADRENFEVVEVAAPVPPEPPTEPRAEDKPKPKRE